MFPPPSFCTSWESLGKQDKSKNNWDSGASFHATFSYRHLVANSWPLCSDILLPRCHGATGLLDVLVPRTSSLKSS